MTTYATQCRIADLYSRVTRTYGEVFQDDDSGRFHFGIGFPGCLFEYQTNDFDSGPESGWDTEQEAQEALADHMLDELRTFDRDTLASTLER